MKDHMKNIGRMNYNGRWKYRRKLRNDLAYLDKFISLDPVEAGIITPEQMEEMKREADALRVEIANVDEQIAAL